MSKSISLPNFKYLTFGLFLLATILAGASKINAEDLKLPPEVTPALRAACETDVRRLCLGENPTVAGVKSCVKRRFTELSMRCRAQIAVAGLTPAGR